MPIVNDLIFDYQLHDYENAKKEFINLCLSSGILEEHIGFFGNVGFPGISDIDGLVVGHPYAVNELNKRFCNKQNHDKRFAYLFWHRPVYVLSSVIEIADQLHTFEGLHPFQRGGDLGGLLKNQTILNDKNESLYIAWFVFLLVIIANQERKLKENQSVSLRLILLIYKNIFHSYTTFGEVSKTQGSSEIVNPQKMRENVRDNPFNDGLRIFIEKSFLELAKETMSVFDTYCLGKFNNYKISDRNVLIGQKDLIFRKDYSTHIKNGKLFNKISLNSIAFQMVSEFYFGSKQGILFQEYVKNSVKAKNEYLNAKVDYAFIQPIKEGSSFTKRRMLRIINKVLK